MEWCVGGRAAGAFGEMAEVAKNSAQEASEVTKMDGEAEKTIDENEVGGWVGGASAGGSWGG